MAIGEFEEVGNVVRQFAADDATVVVGTAIDESLEGELHVTVVATGLGQQQKQQQMVNRGVRPVSAVGQMQATGTGGPAYTGGSAGGGRPYTPATPASYGGGATGGQGYDKPQPQVVRKNATGSAASSGIPSSSGASDHDYLDIPAFLRRQAD